MLVLPSLFGSFLSGKDKKEKEHIVLEGRLVFKQKKSNQLIFVLEDKLGGYYRLTIFEKKITKDSVFLIENGGIVREIFKKRIYSNSNSCYIKEKNTNCFQINFSNSDVKHLNYSQLFFLALKIINEIENEIDCVIYPK